MPEVLVPQKHADALAPVTLPCNRNRFGEIVLFQTELREAIVAAIVSGKVGAHRPILQTADAPDISIQIDIQEITVSQPGLSGTQGVERSIGSCA
jgi:hypothetical protein